MWRSVPASHGRQPGGEEIVLVLSRKINEAITLVHPDGTRIDVLVTDIRRAASGRPYCKLGISAPHAVAVRRSELPELHVYTEGRDVSDSDSQE